VANGVVSVAGTALQAAVGLRGLVGLTCYAAWNLLFAALTVLYLLHLRAVVRQTGPGP
jgi:predicted exporter